jgi:glucose/arabinose dehydrogenase
MNRTRIGTLAIVAVIYPGIALAQQSSAQNNTPAPAAAAIAAPAAAPTLEKPKLVLKEGSDVQLKFAQNLTSHTATEGDPVNLILAEDLIVDNVVVAKAGDKAVGEVSHAKRACMMGRGGELNIRLDYLRVGDTRVMLRGTRDKTGDDATGTTVALTVLFGPIGLIKHGKEIDIKEGTPLKVFVASDTTLPPAS